jgi:hypothetical protein
LLLMALKAIVGFRANYKVNKEHMLNLYFLKCVLFDWPLYINYVSYFLCEYCWIVQYAMDGQIQHLVWTGHGVRVCALDFGGYLSESQLTRRFRDHSALHHQLPHCKFVFLSLFSL